MPFNHLILPRPLLLPPSIFPSIRVFSSELALCIRWPNYGSVSLSISPSNEYSGLISLRIDCPCIPKDSKESSPTPQLKSINSLALSFLYGPTVTSIHAAAKSLQSCPTRRDPMDSSLPGSSIHGIFQARVLDYWKNKALTRWTFVGKIMSLLFNMVTRFLIAFLPRSKHLLISWLQSPFALILEPKKIKFVTV